MAYTKYIDCEEWTDDDGNLHRDNGPARKWVDGNKEYFQHGIYSRSDGPAFVWGKSYEYIVNGKTHNPHGVALYRAKKVAIGMPEVKEYWLDGIKVSKQQWELERKKWLSNGTV
jgi:hypothetical protein